jgi:hypothetical protein
METNLEFKDLTFGCNITDKQELRVYKVVGWDSAKGSVDAIHHLNKVTASISNFKGIELTNEVLNTCDVLLVSDNFFAINDLAVTSQKPFVYLHQIQRSYLAETNEILEYKPIK